MDCNCGGKLNIVRTEQADPKTVKRVRQCSLTNETVTTYERCHPDSNTQHEQRLVDTFRQLEPARREALWSFLRTFNI